MDNGGISFGNIFKNVAFGDTITFHFSLFTLHSSLFTILSPCRGRRPRRPANLPPTARQTGIGRPGNEPGGGAE